MKFREICAVAAKGETPTPQVTRIITSCCLGACILYCTILTMYYVSTKGVVEHCKCSSFHNQNVYILIYGSARAVPWINRIKIKFPHIHFYTYNPYPSSIMLTYNLSPKNTNMP